MTPGESIPRQMSLFPTCDSVNEAVLEIRSRLPIVTHNDLFAALMLYHNSLLKEQEQIQ